MAKAYLLDEKSRQEILRMRHKIDTLSGPGVHNGRETITIHPPQIPRQRPQSPSRMPIRLKIKADADSNGVSPCNTWDGTTLGTDDIPVRLSCARGKAGTELWAMPCSPSAGVTYLGLPVVWTEIVVGSIASPTTIAPTGSTANTATWNQQVDGTPLTFTFMARVAYDTSAHKLYGFNRTLKLDSKGRWWDLSAETRVDVDVLEGC